MTRTALLALGLATASTVAAEALPGTSDDGWHSWRVAAVDNAPAWCCGSWTAGVKTATSCSLDRRGGNIGNDDRFLGDPAEMRLYVQVEDDAVSDIRVVDSRCPVESSAPVRDHGLVEGSDSVRWLERQAGDRDDLRSGQLMAIASHDGEDASLALERYAKPGRPSSTRKQALFWIGQLRMNDSGDLLRRTLEVDDSDAIREHAIFAYSQSNAADRLAVLTKSGRTDESADVRGQAWFWLAETGLAGAEAEIRRAIATDPDNDARDKAVFALAQLPNNGTRALMGVLEDPELSKDTREQALFWLVQSDSDEAWAYLDELFTR